MIPLREGNPLRVRFSPSFPVVLALFASLFAATSCRQASAPPGYRRAEFALASYVEITASNSSAQAAVDEAFAAIRLVESLMSPSLPGSDVARVNAAAGSPTPVSVSGHTMTVLSATSRYAALSNGAFDPTIAPLVRLWGFATDRPAVPSAGDLHSAAALVGFELLALDPTSGTARLDRPGMAIDLGAAAKGYAVDLAATTLQERGVSDALINAGQSSIRALGRRPDGRPWRVALGHPRQPGRYLGVIELSPGQALGTSGDYQQFFVQDGVRYSHILDPHTGYPARDLQAVTVLAGTALDADILSTAVFALGPQAGLALVESLPGVEAILVTADDRIILSTGLSGHLDLKY